MSKMTDEERLELCKKLDVDLDAFLEETMKRPRRVVPEDNRSVDEIVQELKQHPAFMSEYDPSQPMSKEMEGLIALKYNSDDALETAENYKEDGNRNFKLKKYRWAIDNYAEGIKAKCTDRLLNAILYTNRAAANYFIGNYRSAINDCIFARKFKPDHLKAIVKGAQCHVELQCYTEAMTWCDAGLLIDATHEKLLVYRTKSEKLKKVQERDQRKQATQERREKVQQLKLIETIKSRGVTLADEMAGDDDVSDKLTDERALSSLETRHQSGVQVRLDDNGVLHWPVLFLYPEHSDSDLIEQFPETDRLCDHIEHVFGSSADVPGWDSAERQYQPHNIDVYFEDIEREKLLCVEKSMTLAEILKHKRYMVHGGTPGFILLVRDSPFANDFIKRYKQ